MKHKRGFFTGLAMLVCLLALVMTSCEKKPKAAAINMQDGLWEITTAVEMPGMPADMIKPHTVTACRSKSDYVPKDNIKSDCTMKDVKTEGNTVSWTVVCKEAVSKGRITYAGTTYDGTTETTMKQDGKDVTVKATMKGKYIGPCTK